MLVRELSNSNPSWSRLVVVPLEVRNRTPAPTNGDTVREGRPTCCSTQVVTRTSVPSNSPPRSDSAASTLRPRLRPMAVWSATR